MTLFVYPRIIVTVGDDGVVVTPHEIAATPFFVPADDVAGIDSVFRFIQLRPQARITLFADNLAQDYRNDFLPRLNVFDRARLAARRLKQHFPTARLTACLRFRKEPGRALMIGLHESNPVFDWAEKLRARLPDIALLPVEGARVAARLMPDGGWAMLVSRQKSGGFRQIVIHNGGLVFTRLTPLPPDDDGEDAQIIARDIRASLDYLSRHGLRDANELAVLLLMPGDIHDDTAFDELELKSLTSLSPLTAAIRLGLPFAPDESDGTADLLFAAHLAAKGEALRLMLPETKQASRTRMIRTYGLGIACACLGLAVLSSIWRAGDLGMNLYLAQKEAIRLDETRSDLAKVQAGAAPLTEPLGRLREALVRKHIYEQPMPTPWQGLNEFANGAGADANLVRLDWAKIDKAPEVFLVTLRAGDEGDRVSSVAAFADKAQAIAAAMPDYEVTVTKPPYPALPQEAVTGAEKEVSDPTGDISIRRNAP